MSAGKRILFGAIGFAMLYASARGIIVGQYNMHGEPLLRSEQPIAFWFYGAFLACVAAVTLYATVRKGS